MSEEPSIFDPSVWPDVWAELADFMRRLEEEVAQEPIPVMWPEAAE